MRTQALASLLALAAAWPLARAQQGDDELDFLLGAEEAAAERPENSRQAPDEAAVVPLPTAAPTPVAEPRPGGRVIEEIIVTAQKTEQTLQEVPVAVSVVSGDTLRDAGVFGADGLENLVPNLELDMDAQAPTIGVRGFSTDSYNVGLEPSVGIIIDEIPIGRTEFIPDGLFDINRVEVLRGPQGTLFGKNTIAGVLIFGTTDPAPEPEISGLLTVGPADELRAEGALGLPLTDALQGRVSAVSWNNVGDVDNSFLERREASNKQLGARLKFLWDIDDDLQLRFGGQFSTTESTYSSWQLYDLDSDALEYAQSIDPDTEDDPFNNHTSFNLPGFVDRDSSVLHFIADYGLSDWMDMATIAGHATVTNDLAIDFDVSAADLANVRAHFDYSQNSLELRFTGNNNLGAVDFDFVGGLFAFQSQMAIEVDVSVGEDIVDFGASPAGMEALGLPGLSPLGPLFNELITLPRMDLQDGVNQQFSQDAQSVAAFGQLTWFFGEHWSLITGLRLGSDTKDAVLTVVQRGPGITGAVVGAEDFTDDGLRRRESEISPKIGLGYDFSEDISGYASWTRGTKGGGFNAISFNSQDLVFEPEQGDNFELGLKSKLLERSMNLNLTLYHTQVSNMQVVNFNGVSFDVFNAAEAELQGFEADLTWLTPWEWLTLNASLGISSATYTSYPDAPAAAGQDDSPECQFDSAECKQDLAGRTLPKAPELSASLSPTLRFPLGRSLGLEVGVDISHRGDQYLELDLDPHAFQKAHTLVAARISLGAVDERWGLTLSGTNLTDTKALNFVSDHNLYANSYFANQIPGASVALSLSLNF